MDKKESISTCNKIVEDILELFNSKLKEISLYDGLEISFNVLANLMAIILLKIHSDDINYMSKNINSLMLITRKSVEENIRYRKNNDPKLN